MEKEIISHPINWWCLGISFITSFIKNEKNKDIIQVIKFERQWQMIQEVQKNENSLCMQVRFKIGISMF